MRIRLGLAALAASTAIAVSAGTVNHGSVTLTGGFQAGAFAPVYDLTKGGLNISFQADLRGVSDAAGAHAWSQLGVREVGAANFNPGGTVGGKGVSLSTDYEWVTGTFGPDANGPNLDLDDKLTLQRRQGHGEDDYNLPVDTSNVNSNTGVWFDRDGVDQSQAQTMLPGQYNTGGIYDIRMFIRALGNNTGMAWMTVNGVSQDVGTQHAYGMYFTGDMTQMQVFYGLYGYGAQHSVSFNDIVVSQVPEPGTLVLTLGGLALAALGYSRRR